jgi:expansin (peptidoglycan-binding protein)
MKIMRVLSAVLMCLAIAQIVEAQTGRRQTKVRFSAPIEIPNPSAKGGVMILPPGEYIFAMADTGTSHHVVRVTDVTGKTVHSQVLTMPDYRLSATSKTVMYLGERPAGSPAAIKSWFYPGETNGERFIYPKARAQALAAEVKQPVPSRVAEGPITANETVQVQTPEKKEVAYTAKTFEGRCRCRG